MSIDKAVNLDTCSIPNIHVKTGKINDYVPEKVSDVLQVKSPT